MASYAVLDAQSRVVNIAEADASWQPGTGLTKRAASADCVIGGRWTGSAWEAAPAAPPPIPQEITLRQLLFALRNQSWITHAEALAAARTGDMPATMANTLGAVLTPAQREDAALTWAAMYTALRVDPLWQLFIATGTATSAQIDALFVEGAGL